MKINVIPLLFIFTALVVHADDWTTSDGKTFHSVKVLSHDDGYVTIIDSDGGGRVPLRTLTPELQKQFGYDAAKAAACEAATVAQDRADSRAVAQTEQTAQRATPAPQSVPPPRVAVATSLSPAPAPSAHPIVNVAANEGTIRDDKEKLESLNADMQRVTQTVSGSRQADRMTEISTQQAALRAEIEHLEREDTGIPEPVAPVAPTSPRTAVQGPIDVAANNAKIDADQVELDNAEADLRAARRDSNVENAVKNDNHHADDIPAPSNPEEGDGNANSRKYAAEAKVEHLTAEIAELKRQNASVAQATSP